VHKVAESSFTLCFSLGQWEGLWLIERSKINEATGGISVNLATPELVWRSRVNLAAVSSNRRYYLMSSESRNKKNYAFCITILTLFSVTENPKRTGATRLGVQDGLNPALRTDNLSIICQRAS